MTLTGLLPLAARRKHKGDRGHHPYLDSTRHEAFCASSCVITQRVIAKLDGIIFVTVYYYFFIFYYLLCMSSTILDYQALNIPRILFEYDSLTYFCSLNIYANHIFCEKYFSSCVEIFTYSLDLIIYSLM